MEITYVRLLVIFINNLRSLVQSVWGNTVTRIRFTFCFLIRTRTRNVSSVIADVQDTDKNRSHSGRASSEDVRAKSPLSDSRSSLLEKYSFSAGKASERPSSVLDRYNRPASREKSREPEGISRYGSSTYPGSNFGRSYGNDARFEKKDHPPVSYRGLRPNAGRTSREPSPEVGKTNSSFRVYSRAPSYGRSAASSSEYRGFFRSLQKVSE